MAKIICDSGALISLSDTCLIKVVAFLAQRGAQFVVPRVVVDEIVNTPLQIKRYAFSAVRLRKAIDDGDIKVVNSDVSLMQRLLDAANTIYSIRGKPLKIFHGGEADCLAAYFANKCDALAIDEKTTKLLIEDPEKLHKAIAGEYGASISVNQTALTEFTKLTKGVQILRSSDLTAIAAKRGYFNSFNARRAEAFHSAIYAIKNAGCSLSDGEIAEYDAIKL